MMFLLNGICKNIQYIFVHKNVMFLLKFGRKYIIWGPVNMNLLLNVNKPRNAGKTFPIVLR